MEGAERRPEIPHIGALDGARGLAVAGVLLFHGGHLRGGYLGVDFFFTLSGFLITSLLLAESARAGSVGLGRFWARRARRLLPALVVLMLGVVLYAVTLAQPSELAQIRGDAFATLGYVANWRQIFSHQSYFALFTAPSPLNHTWSLAIEEQFYVIWPLIFVGLLAGFRRSIPKAVLVTSLALAAVSSLLMIALYHPTTTNRVYFGTDTRAAAILFGVALAAARAIYGPTTTRRARVALEAVGIVGVLVLAVAWARLDGQSSTLYRGGFLVCGLAATAVIAVGVDPRRGPIARALGLSPLAALGLISYGVYLYHWPIDIVFDENRVGVGGWPLFLIQTLVTLTVAVVSYKIIEQPIRRGALSSAQWRWITPVLAIGLVGVLFASTLGARSVAPVIASGNPVVIATRTRRNAAPNAQRVMIVGDSTAADLGPSFSSMHTDPPLAVFDNGQPGCSFPSGINFVVYDLADGAKDARVSGTCTPSWEAAALKRFRPQVVFWIVSSPPNRMLYHGQWMQACSDPYDALVRRGLRREIARLGAGGARVVITTSAYSRGHFVGTDPAADCSNALRRKVATERGALLVDLFRYICPHRQCRVEQNGATLRPDGYHYEGPGGVIVAKWLIDQVRSRR
jgi:Predicted acyltransferases